MKDVLLLDVTPLTLGIETMGGVATPVIDKNTTIPTKKSQVFSTADDNQTAVTIHVVQGERKQAAQNKSLGRFDLADIPPAPRGMPQIEVTFDIDANGIVNVSAKDKATSKEQQIRIQASGGLSDDDIDQMVKDAEANAEADKERREMIDTKNKAESMAHEAEKNLKEHGDKIDAADKETIEGHVAKIRELLEGDDKDAIESESEALAQSMMKMGEAIYKAQQEAGEGADATAAEAAPEAAADDAPEAEVLDADFEDISDDKK